MLLHLRFSDFRVVKRFRQVGKEFNSFELKSSLLSLLKIRGFVETYTFVSLLPLRLSSSSSERPRRTLWNKDTGATDLDIVGEMQVVQ